jgi:hypothetical protein
VVLKEAIMLKNLLLILLAGIFLGCSYTAGRKYDTTALERIEVGHTTDSEVLAMLGPPLAANKLSNSMEIFEYAYGKRCPIGLGTKVDSMQVQLYNGVVIKKWQELKRY